VLDGALRPLADDEVRFNVGVPQCLQEPHTEDGAGRSGHADNQTSHRKSSLGSKSNTGQATAGPAIAIW